MSNQLGINNYFQAFSREQEREADQYAINTMTYALPIWLYRKIEHSLSWSYVSL